MANLDEAARQDVLQKAAHELDGVECHAPLPAVVFVIFVAEGDAAVFEGDELVLNPSNQERTD